MFVHLIFLDSFLRDSSMTSLPTKTIAWLMPTAHLRRSLEDLQPGTSEYCSDFAESAQHFNQDTLAGTNVYTFAGFHACIFVGCKKGDCVCKFIWCVLATIYADLIFNKYIYTFSGIIWEARWTASLHTYWDKHCEKQPSRNYIWTYSMICHQSKVQERDVSTRAWQTCIRG